MINVDKTVFTEEMYAQNCVGIPSKGNAEYLLETFRLNESVETLLLKKQKMTQSFLASDYFPAMLFSLDLMQILSGLKVRMAIVSGSERFAVDRSIQGNGFSEYIEEVTTGEEVQNNKPAPDVYLLAMEKMGLSPQECLAIEDTEHGVHAAVSAQIPCIGIPNPHTRLHNMSLADMKLENLEQVAGYFKPPR